MVIPHERVLQRIVGQDVDKPAPHVRELAQQLTVEQVVDVPVPLVTDEIIDIATPILRERVQFLEKRSRFHRNLERFEAAFPRRHGEEAVI